MSNAILSLDLNRIFEHSLIHTGKHVAYHGGPVDIAVFPKSDDSGLPAVTVRLAGKGLAGFEVSQIPWGLVNDETKELVKVGRTDRHGAFTVTVQEGGYRVKYVTQDSETDELDLQIQSQLNRDKPIVVPVEDASVPKRPVRFHLAASSSRYGAGATGKQQTAKQEGPIRRYGSELEIWLPTETVPFGVVQVWVIRGGDSDSSTSVLVPMFVKNGQRRGTLNVRHLVGQVSPSSFGYDAQIVTNDAEGLAGVDVQQVQELLELDAVQADADLSRRIGQLKTLLKGTN